MHTSAILEKSVDHGKSWKMFCRHVESVLGLMLMGYNMENHRIRPLYWSSKTAHPPRSPLFFIPVNLVSEDTMNQGFCSGVFLCFLYFSSLFPLHSLSFHLLSTVIILVSFPSPYRLLFIPNPFNPFLIFWSLFYGSTCNFPVMSFASLPSLFFFHLLL